MKNFNGTLIITGFMCICTFILAALKFLHFVSCSWWWVISPMIILVIWETLFIALPIILTGFIDLSNN